MKKNEIADLVNWEAVLGQPRYSGGHVEPMRAIFQGAAEVVAEWVEDDYQGSEAFAYRFQDGSIAIVTDYFGSCSGCDSWEDADDDEVRRMIGSLVNSARVLPSAAEAVAWCLTESQKPENYSHQDAIHLASSLAALG